MTKTHFSRRMVLATGAASIVLPHSTFGQSIESPVEGGIGGTGIVGLLTEFGSLVVSGNYIRTDAQTRYTDGYGVLRERHLRLGDSLTIEASGPSHALVARRVHVTHPLVGPITAITRGGREILVNGVAVTFERPLRGYAVGARVAVSGLWQGSQVRASGVAPARSDQDLVSGDVTRGGGFGRLRIGGAMVQGRGLGGLPVGSFATVVGRYMPVENVMSASSSKAGRFFGTAGPLQRLSIEGYLAPTDSAPGYKIEGLGHSFARNLRLDNYANKRMLFNGGYTGRFAAQSAIELPESSGQRNRVLSRLSLQNR